MYACFCSSCDGLISLVNLVCDVDLPSDYVSDCEFLNRRLVLSPQSVTTALRWCKQCKNTKASMDAAPFPVDAQENASLGGARVSQEQSSTTVQRNAIAAHSDVAVPPADQPPDLEEAEPHRWLVGADVSTWQRNARERVLIKSMENYSKKSEDCDVAITDLERFLLSPEDSAICILTLCRKRVRRRSGGKRALRQRFAGTIRIGITGNCTIPSGTTQKN